MNATHAPGPWWMTETGVRNSGGYIVHTTSVSRYADQNERYEFEVKQRESDKQLIAAAPELLAALQAVLHDCHDLDMVESNQPGRDDGPWLMATNAIEKATGVAA